MKNLANLIHPMNPAGKKAKPTLQALLALPAGYWRLYSSISKFYAKQVNQQNFRLINKKAG